MTEIRLDIYDQSREYTPTYRVLYIRLTKESRIAVCHCVIYTYAPIQLSSMYFENESDQFGDSTHKNCGINPHQKLYET